MSENLQNLPPELQARLAAIVAGQKQAEAPQQQQQQPAQTPPKPPSLMDHLIALRSETALLLAEVASLKQAISANSDVVEAVGQATGQMYQMFQLSPGPTTQGPTFSQGFQAETPAVNPDF